jgi:hypothetical protein
MSLSHHEQSRLRRMEASLCRSDPKLAGMLGIFGRLRAGQRMPAREQAPSWLDRIRQAAALQVLRRLTRQATVPAGRPGAESTT